jgi:hypothetical protein
MANLKQIDTASVPESPEGASFAESLVQALKPVLLSAHDLVQDALLVHIGAPMFY